MIEPNSQVPAVPLGLPEPEILYVDDNGDYTVRPIPPEWLPQAIAERDKIRAWQAEQRKGGGAAESK